MALVHAAARRSIPATAEEVYALLADYRDSHPRILPPAFSDLMVLEGGVGAGTRVRLHLNVGGRGRQIEAHVDEPEPGCVLTEIDVDTGALTTFTVEPDGNHGRVFIEATWEPRSDIAGLIERLVAPRLLGKLYSGELDLIAQWAIDLGAASTLSGRDSV